MVCQELGKWRVLINAPIYGRPARGRRRLLLQHHVLLLLLLLWFMLLLLLVHLLLLRLLLLHLLLLLLCRIDRLQGAFAHTSSTRRRQTTAGRSSSSSSGGQEAPLNTPPQLARAKVTACAVALPALHACAGQAVYS